LDQLNLTRQELGALRKDALIARAGSYGISGMCAFYERYHGNKVPQYQIDEWLVPIFGMDIHDKGIMIEAFRGSWKTTTVSITWGSFFMGHHPERANLVISSSGQSANKITEAITSIVEHSDAWRECFPDVTFDKEKGWGENGYEIKRTDIEYNRWKAMNSARGDPSILGLGIGSKTLIGKHPDGFLLMDDILDEDNTSSMRQMAGVATKVTGTILPFIVEDDARPKGQQVITKTVVIGTPWQEDDVYQDLKDTEEFISSKVPIMRECEPGEGIFIDHKKLYGWYKLTDPKRHSIDSVIRLYKRSGHKEFMRMYMLDPSVTMEGEGLIYFTYPHEKIDLTAQMTCGVDYMSMEKDKNIDLRYRSFYAQAYLFKLPDGRAVVGGGWHDRPTQLEAEQRLEQPQAFHGHRGTAFESDGKGEEALQYFMRNPHLTLIPMRTEGQGKPERLEKQLGPWLENGQILISDEDTPFLNFLRKCLRKYPQWHKDPIDALYWAARLMPEVMVLNKPRTRLPEAIQKQRENDNYWYAVGSN